MNDLHVPGLSDEELATLRSADIEPTREGICLWFELTDDNIERVVAIAQALGSGLDLWTPPAGDTASAPLACLLVDPLVLDRPRLSTDLAKSTRGA